jgi:hypothetical protein
MKAVQFSVWDEPWPKRALKDFLIPFSKKVKTRWYFLYEPNLLVRAELPCSGLLRFAEKLAKRNGFKFQLGDKAASSPSKNNGKFFYGEEKTYGKKINAANEEFLFASTRLMVALAESGKLDYPLIRKHSHLFCNQAGLNYFTEGQFNSRCAYECFELARKYGER